MSTSARTRIDAAAPSHADFVPAEPLGDAELAQSRPEQIVAELLRRAAEMQASDLYVLSDEGAVTAAARQWGIVRPLASFSREKGRQIISHVKALAGLDITEKRRPIDGRWIQEVGEHKYDLRINVIPTLWGEDLTMRMLGRDLRLGSFAELGMSRQNANDVRAMLEAPSGLILVSGPTGTGKTSTLYSCLRHLNNGKRKINTIEDPIEYSLSGVRQSQVFPKIGVDFSDLLRAILRQAPDVIMVGEIRDPDTTVTAVRAANSGHLVLATLHAPLASGAVQSMLALGAHPHFLASSLLGIVAQRLVRKLCTHCRAAYDVADAPHVFDEVAPLLGPKEGLHIYGPKGCDYCHGEGYFERTGIFEVMTFDPHLRRLVADSRPGRELEKEAASRGFIEFRRAALLKVAQGVTSTEEIVRAVPVEYLGIDD